MTPTVASAPGPAAAPTLPDLINALLQPTAYPHPAPAPYLIETHISWVILAGDYAYKLKKPLNLGFLDFSTLEKREHCCREELRLNGRLAPHIYLDVVPIAGHPPQVGGVGPVLEWAVQMQAFPADATLDREAEVTATQIDAIADQMAAFHAEAARVAPESEFGTPAAVAEPVQENFRQLRALLPAGEETDRLLTPLKTWTEATARRLETTFLARKQEGFIRECHGDLHLGNIAWVDGAPLIFDGIEFNPGLHSIDVISEIAFLCMDLMHRGRRELAWRCLNRYLEHTGDYTGLATLSYYLVYRALVRAKVTAIRASQAGSDFQETHSYLALATTFIQPPAPALLLTHGVSGSGKTWLSQRLLEALPAVRLRSDVERKRLHGLPALADSRARGVDIYNREAGERTLAHLLALTSTLLDAGFRVVVDATFIKRAWRDPFRLLAETKGLPWFIMAREVPLELLRERVARRQAKGTDASEAGLEVLDAQLANLDPFGPEELTHVVPLNGDPYHAIEQLKSALA